MAEFSCFTFINVILQNLVIDPVA